MARKAATATKKQPAAKRATAAQPAKPSPAKKASALRAKMSKTAILTHLAAETGLTRRQVGSVMEELEVLIQRHIKKRAVGEFSLPGLLKIRSVKRPAAKKRMGRNPATGEEIEIPARPARTQVRISALKRLKDMVL